MDDAPRSARRPAGRRPAPAATVGARTDPPPRDGAAPRALWSATATQRAESIGGPAALRSTQRVKSVRPPQHTCRLPATPRADVTTSTSTVSMSARSASTAPWHHNSPHGVYTTTSWNRRAWRNSSTCRRAQPTPVPLTKESPPTAQRAALSAHNGRISLGLSVHPSSSALRGVHRGGK